MDAIGIVDMGADVAVERRSTILPPPLRSEVAELDLELLAAYARTDDPMYDPMLEDAIVPAFDADTSARSSDTDLAPISDVPTTLIAPPPPRAALGLWLIPV